MSSPLSSGLAPPQPNAPLAPQRKIDISKTRKRPEPYASKVKGGQATAVALLKKWSRLNTSTFYARTRALLQSARDPSSHTQAEDIKALDDLIAGYRKYPKMKKRIVGCVRVDSAARPGMSSGAGLDELFRTSETMTLLEWSYKPPPDKSATAKIIGQDFDWMDAQKKVRVCTELIIWATDQTNQICGHTGTFQREYKGKWMIAFQILMHDLRQEQIEKRSNRTAAILQVISMHLRVTENHAHFNANDIWTGPEAQQALLANGFPVVDTCAKTVDALARNLDKLKMYYNTVKDMSEAPGWASPIPARNTSGEEVMNSPLRQNPPTSPLGWDAAADEQNLLLDLAPSTEVDWLLINEGRDPVPLTQPPPNAVIVAVEKRIEAVKGKRFRAKCRRNGKRRGIRDFRNAG